VPILPHKEAILEAYNAFGIHRQTIISNFWGDKQFQDIQNNSAVDT